MKRTVANPDTLFNSLQYGFSQISTGIGREIITISGQVGWDETQAIVDASDLAQQTEMAFQNLEKALTTIDCTLDNVISLRIYIVDSVMDDTSAVSQNLKKFFPQSPPTATWIGVSRLADKDFLIEIEAMALR